ncbi:transposase [Shewanella sp. 125m-7]
MDRHAVVLMDGPCWHTDAIADQFTNVCIIKLPPYSLELNLIEQVWSWMRNTPDTRGLLVNSVFKNDQDIVDSVCEAWNTFTESSDLVTKLCSRDWASVTS